MLNRLAQVRNDLYTNGSRLCWLRYKFDDMLWLTGTDLVYLVWKGPRVHISTQAHTRIGCISRGIDVTEMANYCSSSLKKVAAACIRQGERRPAETPNPTVASDAARSPRLINPTYFSNGEAF